MKQPVRSSKTRKAPAKPPGLRLQLRGDRTTEELRIMLLEAVARIEELGIERLRGVNLYVTPLDEHRNPVTPVEGGRAVTNIIIEPYRAAADEHGV